MAYTAQQLVDMGFVGYTGWDDAGANANFMETGGAGKGSLTGGSGDLVDTLTGQVGEALEFDQPAARASAEQEFSPYFDEQLQDYLTEIGIGQERSGEDLSTLLERSGIQTGRAEQDLSDVLSLLEGRETEFLGDIERQSPLKQEQIGGQFADRGLYQSGQRQEAQRQQLESEDRSRQTFGREQDYKTGQAELQTGRTTEDIARQDEQRQLEHDRYLADVERDRKTRERDFAREKEEAITGQVQTLREEQLYGYS